MLDATQFTPLRVSTTNSKRKGGRKGVLTIICSQKNGKRLMLSENLVECLNIKGERIVQIGFVGKKLVLGKKLPDSGNSFALKKQGKKFVIYSAEAVQKIAETVGLDFDSKVSYTWYEMKMDEYASSPVAIFEMKGGDNSGE